MAVFDRIKTTTTSTTSPFVVSTTPPTGYLGFSKFSNGATDIPVAIVHQTANEWQVCYCSWNSATNELTVTSVLLSTNADAAVTFSAGTKDVFVTASSRSVGHLREINTWTANNYFTTGNVGIGTASPAAQLHVVSAANFHPQIIADHVAGAGTGAAYFLLDRARGTPSARTAVVSGDTLGTLMGRGYDGSAQQNAAFLSFDVDGTVSAGNVPAGITFFTTPVGGSTAARMHVDADGNVGIGTTGPGKRLDVVGQLRASNTAASGYALFEYGSSATATNNWHVGSEGDGTFRWYNGNFGAGAELMRITSAGNVGIGTGNPSGYDAKLAVFNGNIALTTTTNRLYLYYASATNHAFLSAAAGGEITFSNGTASPSEKMRIDTSGNVGIGTGTSGLSSRLTVNGSFRQLAPTVPFEWTANAGANDFLKLNAVGYTDNLLTIVSDGRVGIGTASPTGNLTVFSSAANDSSHIRVETSVRPSLSLINSGVQAWSFWVDTGDSNKLKIGSANGGISTGTPYITATAGGNVGVGVSAPTFRFVAGNSSTDGGWIYSASDVSYLGLGGFSGAGDGAFSISYDRSNGNITLNGGVRDTPTPRIRIDNTGNVGINQTSPGARVHVTHPDGTNALLVAGTTKGFRVSHGSTASVIEGVDHTGVGSYQPLVVGGSDVRFTTSNNERMRIHASGAVSIGNTADPGAGITAVNATLKINRFNTTSEGGELQFCRASDDAVGWAIDLLGSGTGTDPTTMRWIDQRAATPASRLELNSRGVLNIVNDLGPASTDTLSVGFRGSPNNDQSANYTLALTDAGRTIRKTVLTAFTVTIPADATVDFPLGTCIMLCNVVNATSSSNTTQNLTIACAANGPALVWMNGGTKINRGSATNTFIRLGGSATLRKVAANLWAITGAGIA